MGNLLTFLELAATSLWFGGAAASGPKSEGLRRWFYLCATVVAAVAVSRGLLWIWTPLHSLTIVLAGVAGVATRWWARLPGIVFGLLYLAWVAWRGY